MVVFARTGRYLSAPRPARQRVSPFAVFSGRFACFGLTKCTDPHAKVCEAYKHILAGSFGLIVVGSQAMHMEPVLGHRKINGGIQPSWLGNPRWAVIETNQARFRKKPAPTDAGKVT